MDLFNKLSPTLMRQEPDGTELQASDPRKGSLALAARVATGHSSEEVLKLLQVGRVVKECAESAPEGSPSQRVAWAIRELARTTAAGQRGLPSDSGEEVLGANKGPGSQLDFSPEIFLCVVGELILNKEAGADRHLSMVTALELVDSYVALYRENEIYESAARGWIKEALASRVELRDLCSVICEQLQDDKEDPGLSAIAERLLEKMVWIYGDPTPTSRERERGYLSRQELVELLGDSMLLSGLLPTKVREDGKWVRATSLPLSAVLSEKDLLDRLAQGLRVDWKVPVIQIESFPNYGRLYHDETHWLPIIEAAIRHSSDWPPQTIACSSDGRLVACCPPSLRLNELNLFASGEDAIDPLPLIFKEQVTEQGNHFRPIGSFGLIRYPCEEKQALETYVPPLTFVPNSDLLVMIPRDKTSVWIFDIGEKKGSWQSYPLPQELSSHESPLELCALSGAVGVIARPFKSSVPIHWIHLDSEERIAAGLMRDPLLHVSGNRTGYLGADTVNRCLKGGGLNLGALSAEVAMILDGGSRLRSGSLTVFNGDGSAELRTANGKEVILKWPLELRPTEECFLMSRDPYEPGGTNSWVREADPRIIGEMLLRETVVETTEPKVYEDLSGSHESEISLNVRGVRVLLEEALSLILEDRGVLAMKEGEFLQFGDPSLEGALSANQRRAMDLQEVVLAAVRGFAEVVDGVIAETGGWGSKDGIAALRQAFSSGRNYQLNEELVKTLKVGEEILLAAPPRPGPSPVMRMFEEVSKLTSSLREIVPGEHFTSPLRSPNDFWKVFEGSAPEIPDTLDWFWPFWKNWYQKKVAINCLTIAKPSHVLPLLEMFRKAGWPLSEPIARTAVKRADHGDLLKVVGILREAGVEWSFGRALREKAFSDEEWSSRIDPI